MPFNVLRELDSVVKATSRADGTSSVGSRQQTLAEDVGDKERRTKHSKLDPSHTDSSQGARPSMKGSSHISKEKLWVSPNLRVRIVDRAYKKGQYYNTKVRSVLVCVLVCVVQCVHVYVCACMCVHVCADICAYVCCACVCVCMCMCVCACVCVHVYVYV